MIVVLSGEGPSDLGSCDNEQGWCRQPEFRQGPMICFVDKEVEQSIGYSLLDITPDRYIFVSKQELVRAIQHLRENRKACR